MRLDHIAYRVAQGNRDEAAKFFIDAFGYKFQDEFPLEFDDGTTAKCMALEPPEKVSLGPPIPWTLTQHFYQYENDDFEKGCLLGENVIQYHLAPEIFISEGEPDSIVGKWVNSRAGVGGIHHLAYQVPDVKKKMDEWKEKGWASFSSEPLICPGLTQVFTEPNPTGVIFEFIKRDGQGFCKDNVKALMQSTKGD